MHRSLGRWFRAGFASVAVLVVGGCGSTDVPPAADESSPEVLERAKSVCYGGKCDGPSAGSLQSPYEADMEVLNRDIWQGDPPMSKIEDAYTVLVDLGQAKFTAPTHLFGVPVNVIPYSNEDGQADAAGEILERGDQVVAEFFPPGEVGVMIKHHRPEYRVLRLAGDSDGALVKESMKLRDTHVGLVVGVERNGKPGAITINNPQQYEAGRFGTKQYSMIFVSLVFPEYLQAERQAFMDNIRTMLLGFNSVSEMPADYNGGDPLAAYSPERVREHAAMMVRAVTGDAEAKQYFASKANKIYCAELAHVALSAGLLVPLNRATLEPMVGLETWNKFVGEMDAHNRGETSGFTRDHKNVMLRDLQTMKLVLTVADEALKPAPDYASSDAEQQKLAFQPMTMADIVEQFLRTHVPREKLGEALAPAQGQLLQMMKPGLLESMGLHELDASDPRRKAVEDLYDALVGVVSQPHESYEAFRAALEPLLDQARKVTGPRDASGTGYFVPPSMFHVVTQGKHLGGLLGLKYEGHGVHVSATRRRADPAAQPSIEPVVGPNEPMAASCRMSCDGFSPDWACACDASCKRIGDCCSDFAEQCPQMQ